MTSRPSGAWTDLLKFDTTMQFSIRLLLFFLLLNLVNPSSVLATSVPQNEPRILLLGDSLSAAYNIPVDQSWPVLFQRQLQSTSPGAELVNASISGETTGGGLQRLPGLLDRHQPSHLIIELGGNDGLRGLSFKQARANLQAMIELARARDIEVLLIGVRLPPNLGPVYSRLFQNMYDSLDDSNDIEYLPRFLGGIAADQADYMQADGIHPTARAQPLLAEKVLAVFRRAWLTAG